MQGRRGRKSCWATEAMTKERSRKIISLLRQYYGDVKPDLRFENLYQLAVSVILSAQTTDKQVNSATPELFHRYPSLDSLAAAEQGDVEQIIKSTGFFRNKAKNIIAMAKAVVERHGGKLPENREELTALPGIGRKSANVILSVGFGIPALAVDTHILRISKRIGYTESEDPLRVENDLTAMIPEAEWTEAHLVLIRHGRTLCPARKPLCSECPVNSLCDYANSIP